MKWIHYRRIFTALRKRDGVEARNAMGALLDLLRDDVIRRIGGAEDPALAKGRKVRVAAAARRG